jgi:hypothetical protein
VPNCNTGVCELAASDRLVETEFSPNPSKTFLNVMLVTNLCEKHSHDNSQSGVDGTFVNVRLVTDLSREDSDREACGPKVGGFLGKLVASFWGVWRRPTGP